MPSIYIPKRGHMAWRLSFASVREIARASGIRSIRQLSIRSGLNQRTVRKYWRNEGVQQIDADVLLKLCEVLDSEPGDLVKRVKIE